MTKVMGAVLIVLGVIGLIWGGFSYTTQKKVVDLGPIQATRESTHSVPMPPIIGGVLLIGGIALIASGKS